MISIFMPKIPTFFFIYLQKAVTHPNLAGYNHPKA